MAMWPKTTTVLVSAVVAHVVALSGILLTQWWFSAELEKPGLRVHPAVYLVGVSLGIGLTVLCELIRRKVFNGRRGVVLLLNALPASLPPLLFLGGQVLAVVYASYGA